MSSFAGRPLELDKGVYELGGGREFPGENSRAVIFIAAKTGEWPIPLPITAQGKLAMTEMGLMKAVRVYAFGRPDALSFKNMPHPIPDTGQVPVRIMAAGVR